MGGSATVDVWEDGVHRVRRNPQSQRQWLAKLVRVEDSLSKTLLTKTAEADDTEGAAAAECLVSLGKRLKKGTLKQDELKTKKKRNSNSWRMIK